LIDVAWWTSSSLAFILMWLQPLPMLCYWIYSFVSNITQILIEFIRRPALSAKDVLAMVLLSVCPSVTTRYQFKHRWDWDSRFLPYDSTESVVSCEQISCRWVRRFPSNEGIKEGYPPPVRNRYFTIISSFSVRTVADRHRLAAHHNKHCWRAFWWYHHRWPCMTLNLKNRGFKVNFRDFRLQHTFQQWTAATSLEVDQDNLRMKLNWCCRASHEH